MRRLGCLAVFLCVVLSSKAEHDNQKKADCDHPAKCETGVNLTCFHNSLSYSGTSLELVDDVESLQGVDEKLEQWKLALSQIPRCWRLVQPLLCSLYRPPCSNGSVPLPTYNHCERARTACRISAIRGIQWPHFLSCERDIFRRECKYDNRAYRISSNISRECISPLVFTKDEESWYSDIDECGISCKQHPLLTPSEQSSMRDFVFAVSLLSAICCASSVIIYLISWPSSKKYPTVTGFYASVCLLLVCAGYSAQFIIGPDPILCKKDGTIRRGEPAAEDNFACLSVFIACYYFLFAAITWMVLMCYAWSESVLYSSSRGGISEGQTAYFHLIAWCVPFVLTLTVMAFSEIEGDSITGVCFITQNSMIVRLFLLLIPCIVAFGCTLSILARLEYKLVKLKSKSFDEHMERSIFDERTLEHIEKAIFRLGMFLVFVGLLFLVNVYCHIYEFRHTTAWKQSLREHFSCRANVRQNSGDPFNNETCEPKSKPSVTMLKIHLMIFFFTCFTMFLVTLQLAATRIWEKLFKKTPSEETDAAPGRNSLRSNILAEAFARLEEDECCEEEEAPDSVSQNFSPRWPAALQPFRTLPSPVMIDRRYSSTSDVSRQTAHWAQSIARKRKTRKERDRHRVVEKTTSTADLEKLYGVTTPLIPQLTAPIPLVNKSLTNKKNLINPPFTHGMSGESRNNNLNPFRPKPRKSPLPVPQSPPKAFYGATPVQAPMAFMPPMFPVLNPYTGFPMNPYSPFFMSAPHMMAPAMCNEFVPFPDVDNIKSPLIPLKAHETGSEASFRMPFASDTEYDTEAYRPQTAIPKDARQPRSGKLSALSKKKSGFFSS